MLYTEIEVLTHLNSGARSGVNTPLTQCSSVTVVPFFRHLLSLIKTAHDANTAHVGLRGWRRLGGCVAADASEGDAARREAARPRWRRRRRRPLGPMRQLGSSVRRISCVLRSGIMAVITPSERGINTSQQLLNKVLTLFPRYRRYL